MENVQKFALVDPQILKNLQDKTPTRTTPTENALSALDTQMKDIVEGPGTIEGKVKLYNQALQRYRFYTDSLLSKPLEFTVTGKRQLGTLTGETEDEGGKKAVRVRIIDSIPKTLKYKARRVLDTIKETPGIDFSPSGQLTIDGKTIQGSNVEDLVHNAVRTRHPSGEEPVGWTDFLAFLKKANVPSSLLGYKKRRVATRQRLVRPSTPSTRLRGQWVNL